ncbi:MAG: helix-turn-helix transcriptional regulator [Firmicutes bacterium]|nr:helix-turn-helix transcriptional regulator [Bacillota bacterium]
MRLKELRNNFGVSQEKIGEYIGCSGAVYSRYETGARQPSIEVMIKLAQYFGVSLDYLVGNKDFEETSLSEREIEILKAFRDADPRARADAYRILRAHPLK